MQALAPRVAGARPSATVTASVFRCPAAILSRPPITGASSSHVLSSVVQKTCSSGPSSTPRCAGRLISRAAAAPVVETTDDTDVTGAVDAIIRYAINLARASETYEVHSWMILLGILKYETCTAAQILKQLGLEDLYGAWNEVLWALNVCDGLKPRSFVAQMKFSNSAAMVLTTASNFAEWHGKSKMGSEDLLMALAAGEVLEGLFPDLNLRLDRVRKAVEKHTGRRYVMPNEKEEERGPLKSEDDVSFL